MTPNARFTDFLKDIEPSATTKSNASSAHTTLRKALRDDEQIKPHHKTDFLSGSYKRDTAIRPRVKNGSQERPDVDIVVVTNHSLEDDPEEVVDLLFDAIKRAGYSPVRRQARSIGLETSKADMDVVPLIEPYDGMYYIPDRKQEAWLQTNPPGHTTWTTQRNDAAGGRFKPNVKMFKWWRRQNSTISKRPKGFILEVIAAECMDDRETHYGELFVGTLETIVTTYRACVAASVVPTINDPSLPGNNIMTGISVDAFEGFYNKIEAHAEIGRQAIGLDDDEKATAKWRQLFGDRFPRGVSKESQSLLSETVATSSLSFPDRQIKPSKKRQGFA